MNPSLHPRKGAEQPKKPGHAEADAAAPRRFPQALLALTASAFCVFTGLGFVFQAEAVLFSALGYALLFGGGYAQAAGAVLLMAGAYWLFAAVKLAGGGAPPLEPRCFGGGNALLFGGVLCFASMVGRGHFAADPAGGLAAPVLGTAVMAAGLYWMWTAARLLGGDGRPAADLRCFVAGHVMLAASVAGFSAAGALFDLASAMPDLRSVIVYFAGGFIFVPALFWLLTAIRRLRGKPPPSQNRFVLGNALVAAGLASALWWVSDVYHSDSFGGLIMDLVLWHIYVYLGIFLMLLGIVIAIWPADRQQRQIAELLAELRKERRARIE